MTNVYLIKLQIDFPGKNKFFFFSFDNSSQKYMHAPFIDLAAERKSKDYVANNLNLDTPKINLTIERRSSLTEINLPRPIDLLLIWTFSFIWSIKDTAKFADIFSLKKKKSFDLFHWYLNRFFNMQYGVSMWYSQIFS